MNNIDFPALKEVAAIGLDFFKSSVGAKWEKHLLTYMFGSVDYQERLPPRSGSAYDFADFSIDNKVLIGATKGSKGPS